jgi:hypothetical protein
MEKGGLTETRASIHYGTPYFPTGKISEINSFR